MYTMTPPPAQPGQPTPTRLPPFWEVTTHRVVVGFFLLLVVLAGVKIRFGSDDAPATPSGGSFYASAGWTINRAADLSVKIQLDDGVSDARADCAMKAIVGVTTWLEWQAMSLSGQLTTIRAAEARC